MKIYIAYDAHRGLLAAGVVLIGAGVFFGFLPSTLLGFTLVWVGLSIRNHWLRGR